MIVEKFKCSLTKKKNHYLHDYESYRDLIYKVKPVLLIEEHRFCVSVKHKIMSQNTEIHLFIVYSLS